jgi:hypothetical protein
MPRKKKVKAESPAVEPIALAEPLEQVMQSLPAPEPQTEPEPGPHAAAVLANRPDMRPVPQGFISVFSAPSAGIRVSKSLDKRTAAIQFAEDRLPERGEKDRMEIAGIKYDEHRRQWERKVPPGMELGENTIDAVRVAKALASEREGRGR